MANQPLPSSKAEEARFQPAAERAPTSHHFLADLCALENLRQAYGHLKESRLDDGADALAFETVEKEGVETFLKQLGGDLQARTYRPTRFDGPTDAAEAVAFDDMAALRDRVVHVALEHLLESAFPPAFPASPEPKKTLEWLAANIDKGLSRVHAVNLNHGKAAGWKRLLDLVSRRIDDPELIALLKQVLAASGPRRKPAQNRLIPLLANIVCEDIDDILHQAMAFGREGNFLHVQCTRVAGELVMASDRDPRHGWIFPAVHKRLQEELAKLHYDPAAIDVQSLDLTSGEPLRFLGHELSCVRKKSGEFQVQYQLAEDTTWEQGEGEGEEAPARRRRPGRYNPLRLLQPILKRLERWRAWRFLQRGCRKANGMQVRWSYLSITLLPIFMVFFGWRSLVALICLGAIFVCNWHWYVFLGRGVHTTSKGVYRRTKTIQVGWRHLPVTLFPILLIIFGWRSPVPWLCLALIFVCNPGWARGIVRWSGRHKVDALIGACAVTALIFASPLLLDIYANRPREVAESSPLPPGFFLGEYHGPSWWYGETTPAVSYGLYVPPNFQGQTGPFPLIVFLHGYGERTKARIFEAGLPLAIARRFGTNKPNGHLQFVAFFPIDPTGQWQAGSPEVENIMATLDHVIGRHQIDPSRIYLTGLSIGGSGVWNLAEAYPDKWAAVVPVCSFTSPEVEKVKHLPAWIFHGARDQEAPVERERILVQQLKEAGADVRYTEFPNRWHAIWPEAYNPKGLYEWLASKSR